MLSALVSQVSINQRQENDLSFATLRYWANLLLFMSSDYKICFPLKQVFGAVCSTAYYIAVIWSVSMTQTPIFIIYLFLVSKDNPP